MEHLGFEVTPLICKRYLREAASNRGSERKPLAIGFEPPTSAAIRSETAHKCEKGTALGQNDSLMYGNVLLTFLSN